MRVLIAGLGAIGQRHARNLRTLVPGVELLAYRRRGLKHVITPDLDSDADQDVELALGITSYTDLDRALATRPDAVFVCTPSSEHVHVARRAVHAGCHIYLEKPVSHTMDGVLELQQAVGDSGVVAMVGCQWRFHPLVERTRALLAGGQLGVVQDVIIEYAEYLPAWHPYEDYRQSYAARAELGGGVVLTHIHDYDLAWWLCGAPTSVMATGGTTGLLDVDVEDTVVAELSVASGVVTVQQTFASRDTVRRFTVRGSEASLHVDLITGTLRTEPESIDLMQLRDVDRNQMFLSAVAHFLACIRSHELPRTSLADGISVLRVALAVKESLRTGHRVVFQ